MKKILLLASVLVLVACGKGTTKETSPASTNQSQSTEAKVTKEKQELKFVVAPQYEGKTSELIEFGKQLTEEHPEVGRQGSLSINYTGSTYKVEQQDYAVFLLINKAGFSIDKNFEFLLSWFYDGQAIYDQQPVGYKIDLNGVLPDQSATLLVLPITTEQKKIVDSMVEQNKMTLEMSGLKVEK